MSIEQEVLDFLNTNIREEHGNRVTLDSKWMEAEVDSFGTTVVFMNMDDKYPGRYDNEWFGSVQNWVDHTTPEGLEVQGITIREIVNRAL